MGSTNSEQRPWKSKRGLFGTKYILAIIIVIAAIFLIKSRYSSPTPIVQGSDFTVKTISGDNFSVNSNKGKVIVINFMSTTCSVCGSEIVQLKQVWHVYGGKIVMLSISVNPLTGSDNLRSYANHYNASWMWASDVAGATEKYQVTTTPTTLILDQEGQVRYKHEGFTTAPTFLQEIEGLINNG